MKKLVLLVAVIVFPISVHAEGVWSDIKKSVSGAADSASDAAKSATEKETPAETRNKIDSMANATVQRLFREQASAKKIYDKSYGYAVFDTRKFSFMITSGFGAGVAVEKATGQRAYMKMATGGMNVGMGGEFFQLVILFENKITFETFVNEGFEAGSEASAVAGSDAKDAGARFTQGMAVYELTEKGLKLAVDFTGTKYWKDDELN